MSSNQNSSFRRIRSISRRLTSRVVGRKISVCLGHDFILLMIILLTWFGTVEYVKTGVVDLKDRNHRIVYEKPDKAEKDAIKHRIEEVEKGSKRFIQRLNEFDDLTTKSLKYVVTDKYTKDIIIEIYFSKNLWRLFVYIGMIFLFQVILNWIRYPSESKRIKKILEPLNSLAQQADMLAKYDFSEDKYQLIEEKITSLEPGEEQKISLGDEDLIGIENAMNSLLARIRESNRQQARFVNDASHELRTPIAVIQGYANMLVRWGKEDEKVLDESIHAILNESENMKHLVEQLLFLARGDAGRTIINKKKLNINSLMQEVYEESLMIDENHIYKYKTTDTEIFIMADEGLVKQALRILLDNAAKYTSIKDEIILSVGVNDKKEAYLQVQDSGIGMKQADVEHMFERFYRADEARSFNGTGLGLSIAKWIVDKHNGHFEIISREEIGTRIGMYFDRVEDEVA